MQTKKIAKKLKLTGAYVAGRFSATILTQQFVKIAFQHITSDFAFKQMASRVATFSVSPLSIYGMVEQSSLASRRLYLKSPYLFNKLREKDLDLLYFLLEGPMEKQIDVIREAERNPAAFKRKMALQEC